MKNAKNKIEKNPTFFSHSKISYGSGFASSGFQDPPGPTLKSVRVELSDIDPAFAGGGSEGDAFVATLHTFGSKLAAPSFYRQM